MPGVKGQSGGQNRLSAKAHQLRGTYRPGRHGQRGAPSGAATTRLDDLRALYDFHKNCHARLRDRLLAAEALQDGGKSVDTSRMLRELRAHAELIARLAGALGRAEIDMPAAADQAAEDEWAELLGD